jgi:pimeloyl-ACP methyl ester carboxylesterase
MWVRVNGVRLFFDAEGAGLVPDGPRMREKPTVVLLHGSPRSKPGSVWPFPSTPARRAIRRWPSAPSAVPRWFTRPGGEGRTFNLFPVLSRVQCPTLVLGGEADPMTPIECRESSGEA